MGLGINFLFHLSLSKHELKKCSVSILYFQIFLQRYFLSNEIWSVKSSIRNGRNSFYTYYIVQASERELEMQTRHIIVQASEGELEIQTKHKIYF